MYATSSLRDKKLSPDFETKLKSRHRSVPAAVQVPGSAVGAASTHSNAVQAGEPKIRMRNTNIKEGEPKGK